MWIPIAWISIFLLILRTSYAHRSSLDGRKTRVLSHRCTPSIPSASVQAARPASAAVEKTLLRDYASNNSFYFDQFFCPVSERLHVCRHPGFCGRVGSLHSWTNIIVYWRSVTEVKFYPGMRSFSCRPWKQNFVIASTETTVTVRQSYPNSFPATSYCQSAWYSWCSVEATWPRSGAADQPLVKGVGPVGEY